MPQFRGSLAAILSSSLILQPVAARVYEHLQSFRQLHAQAFLPPFFWVPPFADPSFFRAPPFSGPLLFLGPSFSGPFLPAVFRVSLSLIDMPGPRVPKVFFLGPMSPDFPIPPPMPIPSGTRTRLIQCGTGSVLGLVGRRIATSSSQLTERCPERIHGLPMASQWTPNGRL